MNPETKARIQKNLPAWIVSGVGILVLTCAFVLWLTEERPEALCAAAAACSLALFIAGCIRFVPGFLAFLTQKTDPSCEIDEPKHILLGIAALALAVEALLFAAVTVALSVRNGNGFTFRGAIEFWRCLDSGHYLDITREWYLSEGDWGRIVQLVFLPGYPLAVYPVYRILGNDVVAGLLVSFAAFPAACCVLYRLLRLDYDHEDEREHAEETGENGKANR